MGRKRAKHSITTREEKTYAKRCESSILNPCFGDAGPSLPVPTKERKSASRVSRCFLFIYRLYFVFLERDSRHRHPNELRGGPASSNRGLTHALCVLAFLREKPARHCMPASCCIGEKLKVPSLELVGGPIQLGDLSGLVSANYCVVKNCDYIPPLT